MQIYIQKCCNDKLQDGKLVMHERYVKVYIQWFDNAPRYLLIEGKKFMIFDGLNAIGNGQIIEAVFEDC